MHDYIQPIVLSIITFIFGGGILTIFFTTKKQLQDENNKRIETFEKRFNEEKSDMIAQFNTLANNSTIMYNKLEENLKTINEKLERVVAIKERTDMLSELFLEHQKDYKDAIKRIHDKIDKMKDNI